jgi:SIR2-like domain
MSTTGTDDASVQTEYKALQTLYAACLDRRPIVPLLGAGISVESGYPTTGSIVRYLAKVRYFLNERLYLPDQVIGTDRETELCYESNEHIGWFGWPDPFQLSDDLWNCAQINQDPKKLSKELEGIYQQYHKAENPDEAARLTLMYKLFDRATEEEQRDFARVSKDRDGLTDDEVRAFLSFRRSPAITPKWRPFLRWVTDRRAEYVDSLFQMLNRGRAPGNSHRFLAFLTRLMGWRLILTTNFDDLIERAMRSEGLSPMVFDVWRQAELPNELLVSGSLSVVKLHGSAYGLRVGESLDDPLADHETAKLLGYLPKDALLLVIGYGGYDRRIMDLVTAVLKRLRAEGTKPPHLIWTHVEAKCPRHVEGLAKRDKETHPASTDRPNPPIITARIHDAGAFLVGLHTLYTQTHPASSDSYSAHSQRPLGLEGAETTDPLTCGNSPRSTADPWKDYREQENQRPVHVFTGAAVSGTLPEDVWPSDASSIAMSEFLAKRASTHTPIWLDARVYQSVEELVSEVVRRCHKHDAALPSVSLAMRGTDRERQRKGAVNRICTTLRRGSYILAIDGIAEFGRPPTTHHGLPAACAQQVLSRVQEFRQFLGELVRSADRCGDSYICLAMDEVADRFSSSGRDPTTDQKDAFKLVAQEIESFRREMCEACALKDGRVFFYRVKAERRRSLSGRELEAQLKKLGEAPAKLGKEPLLSDVALDDLDALLSSFRRPRSRVAIRKLVENYIQPYYDHESNQEYHNYFERFLKLYVDRGFLERIGGELYWMTQKTCDTVYDDASAQATGKELLDILEAPPAALEFYGHGGEPATIGRTANKALLARQVARLACQHKEIASYYYSDLFLAGKDVSAFFEYLYHRISSIRYATILAALVFKCADEIRRDRETCGPAIPNPVDKYLDSVLQATRASERRKTRLDDIRALEQTLVRDREVLLSQVPSDTLLGWIEWIVTHDLVRFCARYYVLDKATQIPGEPAIETEVRELLRMLLDLRAKVLRQKTDYEACIDARIMQIEHLLADLEFPVQVARMRQGNTITSSIYSDIINIQNTISKCYRDDHLGKLERRRCFAALTALLDISVCLNLLGRCEEAASIIAWLRWAIEDMKAKRGKEDGMELAEHYEALELKIHFRAAELILTPVERWDYKNDALEASDHLKERCKAAIEECDAGLSLVHETNTKAESYFVYRSYFRIHRARAQALRSSFVTAQQGFVRAMAGLDPRTGTGRNALAVRALYLADGLMAWSDYQLMSNCKSPSGSSTTEEMLSPQGQFFLGFDTFVLTLDPNLTSSEDRDMLRRCMSPWVNYLPGDPVQAHDHALRTLILIRAMNPGVGTAARLEESLKKDLATAWIEAIRDNVDEEHREAALERSLAYRSAESLKAVKMTLWDWQRIGEQELANAHSTLDQAEGYLTNGRRDIRFWYLLHRLRAQACFGQLLMMLTRGPGGRNEIAATSAVEATVEQKPAQQRFHADFVDRARAGIRALVHAYHNLLDDKGARAVALRRLHFQILLACAYNEWIEDNQWNPPKATAVGLEEFANRFWRRWSWLNRSAGNTMVEVLDTSYDCRKYVKAVLNSADVRDYSLSARAFVERHIKIFYNPLPPVPDLSAAPLK